jgi:ATP-binding cassette subfamily B protein
MAPEPSAPDRRAALSMLSTYLRPEGRRLTALVVLTFGTVGLDLYVPQLLRRFIDGAQGQLPLAELSRVAVVFLVLAMVKKTAEAAGAYVGQDLRWRATNRMRADLTRHTLRLGMDFHHGQTPGKMIERVDGDVTALSNLMSDTFLKVASNILVTGGVLILLAREDWRLGAAFAVFVLVAGLGLRRAASIAVPAWTRVREASAERFGFLEEKLAGTEDIRALGARDWVLARFLDGSADYRRLHRRAGMLGSAVWVGTIALFTMGNALAFGMSAWLFTAGGITVGTVYLIFHYTEKLREPIEQLSHQLEEIQRAGGAMQRVVELFRMPVRQRPEGGLPLPGGALGLQIHDLSFSYVPERPALSGLSVHLRPGEVLGLLGRTGSGKTTLSRLLFRLYDIDGGSVKLGGVELREAHLQGLRQRIGLVTQDVQVLGASVRENLRFFDPAISDARIHAALSDLGLADWLAALPQGLDTELEAGAGGLSAGEAQLLAFARVFLRDPGLVILDEASARLDPATEQRIERAVDQLLAGRTGIVIAHRLGTVARCDQILILEDGRQLEAGERRTLLADSSSRFSRLMALGQEYSTGGLAADPLLEVLA